jgi:Ca2+:H+ antiporter
VSFLASRWPVAVPPAGALLLGAAFLLPLHPVLAVACALGLFACVTAAVHHAEVVAHRVGEPYGTLVLALAISAIEVALVLSLTLAGGPGKAALARDTVYATVMIICNGVIGLCVLLGAWRHREQTFRIEGFGPAYAALVALAALVLVLPRFTTSAPGSAYSSSQLVFVGAASFALWCVFVFFQTVRHRNYFLPPEGAPGDDAHAAPPSRPAAGTSLALLVVSLVAVVGLAKALSPGIEAAVARAGAPPAVVGILVALVVLLPETMAAVRAARANRLQTSMNLALGSALATIGLTIPAVVAAAVLFDVPLVLGLDPKDLVLLAVTFVVGAIATGSGRTNLMQGAVQLVLFAAFLFLAVVP